jgi:hypothetical protein
LDGAAVVVLLCCRAVRDPLSSSSHELTSVCFVFLSSGLKQLVIMTYNVGFFFVIILASMAGYFFFQTTIVPSSFATVCRILLARGVRDAQLKHVFCCALLLQGSGSGGGRSGDEVEAGVEPDCCEK